MAYIYEFNSRQLKDEAGRILIKSEKQHLRLLNLSYDKEKAVIRNTECLDW